MIDTTMAVSGYSGFQLVSDPELFVGAGICNRTPQVQAGILTEIGGGVMCDAVTDAQLERIMDPRLVHGRDQYLAIRRLCRPYQPDGAEFVWKHLKYAAFRIFSNLRNLERLFLNNNQFTELPDGVFNRLTNPTGVRVDGNSANPLPLTLTLQEIDLGMAVIEVAPGVPFTSVTATVSITGGTFSGDTQMIDVMISKGETRSSSFSFTSTAAMIRIDSTSSTPENILNGFSNGMGYSGLRSPQVLI